MNEKNFLIEKNETETEIARKPDEPQITLRREDLSDEEFDLLLDVFRTLSRWRKESEAINSSESDLDEAGLQMRK